MFENLDEKCPSHVQLLFSRFHTKRDYLNFLVRTRNYRKYVVIRQLKYFKYLLENDLFLQEEKDLIEEAIKILEKMFEQPQYPNNTYKLYKQKITKHDN